MNKQTVEYPGNLNLLWTNGTGSDVAAGAPVFVKGRAYIAFVPIPDTKSGTLLEKGRFKLAKVSGTAFAQGDLLCWDTANARLDLKSAKPEMPTVGRTPFAAASGDTTASVDLNEGIAPRFFSAVVSSGQAAANSGNGLVSFETGEINPHTRAVVTVLTASTGVTKIGFTVTTDGSNTGQLNIAGVAGGVQLDAGDVVNAIVG